MGTSMDLTGKWVALVNGNKTESTYYLRQTKDKNGNINLYWIGVPTDICGKSAVWSNAAFGTFSADGKNIGINWADVPWGSNEYSGAFTLEVVDADNLKIAGEHTNFGATGFSRIQ